METLAALERHTEAVTEYLKNPPQLGKALSDFNGFNLRERRFRYLSMLGEGMTAVTLRFAELNGNGDGSYVRQVAVKIAATPDNDDDVRNDLYWLRILRNSRHVVDVIDVDQTLLARPICITELLRFGCLYDVQKRVIFDGLRWPSRLLWRIFLCRESSS